jgi:putative membrane protein
VKLSKEITPEQTATMQKLERATGAEFDKEFLAAFSDDHQSLISSYEKASQDQNEMELKVIVDKTIPMLNAHRAAAIALAAK